jgi:hypothetical protein
VFPGSGFLCEVWSEQWNCTGLKLIKSFIYWSTVVEHSTNNQVIKGSNHAVGTGKVTIFKKISTFTANPIAAPKHRGPIAISFEGIQPVDLQVTRQ